MSELATRVTIEPAKNGYMAYINDFPGGPSVRTAPYVFETMESLLTFIKKSLTQPNEFNFR